MFIIRTYRINRITRNIWLPICCLDAQIREDYSKIQSISVYVFDFKLYKQILYVIRGIYMISFYYPGFWFIGVTRNFEQDASSFCAIISIETGFILAIWKAEWWIRDEWKECVTPFITRTILGTIYWTLPHIEQMAFL